MIMTEFYYALPNLREINVNYTSEYRYDMEPENGWVRFDGAIGQTCSDGRIRYMSDDAWETDDDEEDDEEEQEDKDGFVLI
jgi:hypothetical protein